MKYAIIVSKKDLAGMNIKDRLLSLYEFSDEGEYYERNNVKLYTAEKESIHCENMEVDGDVMVFATKHKSAAGKPSLSVHVPGNWDKAEAGGEERTLCVAPASLLKEMFLELNKQGESFEGEITLEATHHGPKVSKPAMFIEIGSSEEQWTNERYGEIIAKTIMNVLNREVKEHKTMFAIGGGHYPREFNKLLLRTDIAIGHICPKYMLEKLDERLVKQAIDKTVERVDTVLLDWKGLGKQKENVVKILENLNLNTERIQKLLKSA